MSRLPLPSECTLSWPVGKNPGFGTPYKSLGTGKRNSFSRGLSYIVLRLFPAKFGREPPFGAPLCLSRSLPH